MSSRTLHLWDVPKETKEMDILLAFPNLKLDSVLFSGAASGVQQVAVRFRCEDDLLQSADKPVRIKGIVYELSAVPKDNEADSANATNGGDLLDEYISFLNDGGSGAVGASPSDNAKIDEANVEAPNVPPFVCYLPNMPATVGFADLIISLQQWESVVGMTMPSEAEPASVTFGCRDDLVAFLANNAHIAGRPALRKHAADVADVAPVAADCEDSDLPTDEQPSTNSIETLTPHLSTLSIKLEKPDSPAVPPSTSSVPFYPPYMAYFYDLDATGESVAALLGNAQLLTEHRHSDWAQVEFAQRKELVAIVERADELMCGARKVRLSLTKIETSDADAGPPKIIDHSVNPTPTVDVSSYGHQSRPMATVVHDAAKPDVPTRVKPRSASTGPTAAAAVGQRIIHPINPAEIPFYPPYMAYLYDLDATGESVAALLGNAQLLTEQRHGDWAQVEFAQRKELVAIVERADELMCGARKVRISLKKVVTTEAEAVTTAAAAPKVIDHSVKPKTTDGVSNGHQPRPLAKVVHDVAAFEKPRSASAEAKPAAAKKYWPKKHQQQQQQQQRFNGKDDASNAPHWPRNNDFQAPHFHPYQRHHQLGIFAPTRWHVPQFGPPPPFPMPIREERPFPPPVGPVCVFCHQHSGLVCSHCGAPYCSNRCQHVDWPHHSRVCTPIPALVPRDQFYVAGVPPIANQQNGTAGPAPAAQQQQKPSESTMNVPVTATSSAVSLPSAEKPIPSAVKPTPSAAKRTLTVAAPAAKPATTAAAVAAKPDNPFKKKPIVQVVLGDSKLAYRPPVDGLPLSMPVAAKPVAAPPPAAKPVAPPAPAKPVAPPVAAAPKRPSPPPQQPPVMPKPVPTPPQTYKPMLRDRISVPYCDIPAPYAIVCITEVIKPDCCFIRPSDPASNRQYSDVLEKIGNFASKAAKPLTAVPVLGQVILAQHPRLVFQCRAQVMRLVDGGARLAVAFIDFGHLAVMPMDKCMDLAYELQHLTRFVHRVSVRLNGDGGEAVPLDKLGGKQLRIDYAPPFGSDTLVKLRSVT